MYATSIDVLYGVISIAIALFTVFLVWMMYYVVQILKQGNEVVADIREKIEEFETTLATIKDKVVTSATTISAISGEIGRVVDFVKSRRADDEEEEDESPRRRKKRS